MLVKDKNKQFPNTVETKDENIDVSVEEVEKTINNTLVEAENIENSQKEAISKSSKPVVKKKTPEVTSPNLSDKKISAYEKYKNIDWNMLSPKKVMAINAEIMIENKRLYQEAIQSTNYINELEKSNFSVVSMKKELDSVLDYIISQLFCCNSIMQRVNDGERIGLYEKADLIVKCIITNETQLLNDNQKFVEKIKEYKKILTNLQNQLYDLTVKKNNEMEDEKQTYQKEDIEQMINITPSSNDIIITATPLENAKKAFNNEIALAVAEAIGKKGLSEFPEICTYCAKEKGFNDQKVETTIFNMEKEKLVNTFLIKPFNRTRGVRLVEFTKEIGVKIYKEVFKENPVETEMQLIQRENDNYEHGYSIKDVYFQLLSNGYKEEATSMSRNKNTITVSGSITWVPDIVAKHPVSNKVEYYEVETGKCNQRELEYKLDKAVLVTNKLKIIVPNKQIADSYLEYVKNWYNSKKTQPAITIVILSFAEFKNKDKTSLRCYPKVLKEDVNISNEILSEIQKSNKNSNNKPNKVGE